MPGTKALQTRFEHATPIPSVAKLSDSVPYYVEVLGFTSAESESDDFTCGPETEPASMSSPDVQSDAKLPSCATRLQKQQEPRLKPTDGWVPLVDFERPAI